MRQRNYARSSGSIVRGGHKCSSMIPTAIGPNWPTTASGTVPATCVSRDRRTAFTILSHPPISSSPSKAGRNKLQREHPRTRRSSALVPGRRLNTCSPPYTNQSQSRLFGSFQTPTFQLRQRQPLVTTPGLLNPLAAPFTIFLPAHPLIPPSTPPKTST